MADLIPVPGKTPVPQIETNTRVRGGPGGPANQQAQALLNRQALLEQRTDRAILSFPDLASAEAAAASLPDGQVVMAPDQDSRLSEYWSFSGALQFKKFVNTVISVEEFGAKPNSGEDETEAFSRLTAYVKTLFNPSIPNSFDVAVHIPPGSYSVSSWNLTSLTGRSINIMAHGATLIGNAAGKVVLDALGSRWTRTHGLKVVNKAGIEPLCGIQIGPKGLETCGNNTFNDVDVIGNFSRAAFHNAGSETTQHFGCTYLNRSQAAGAYAYIGDGLTRFVPESEYATVTRTLNTAVSFTNNSHFGSQFRNEGGGDAVFLAQTSGWLFDPTTYFLSFNGGAVRLYGTSVHRNNNLTIDGLFETDQVNFPVLGNTGIKYGVILDGDGTSTAIDGLYMRSAQPLVTVSMFHNANASPYRLSNVDLRIQGFKNDVSWFSGGGQVNVSGNIETRESEKLNLNLVSSFTGTLRVNNFTAMGKPVSGAYQVFDSEAEAIYLAGDTNGNQRVYLYESLLFADGPGASAAGRLRAKGGGAWSIGNESNTRALQVEAGAGASSGVTITAQSAFPRIRPNTDAADSDLQVEGKGAGKIRFGAFAASGDAPTVGYIEIKDAGGTVRKLAVVG